MASYKRSEHEEQLFQRLAGVVEAIGYALIDVELRTEEKKRFLRLIIDKRGGVNIDDCEKVSEVCDPLLEEWGEDKHDYFEVQSPGLDRPLLTLTDFLLHLGEKVEVSLYQKVDGEKKFSAILEAADEEKLSFKKLPAELSKTQQKKLKKKLAKSEDGSSAVLEEKIINVSYEDLAQVKRYVEI